MTGLVLASASPRRLSLRAEAGADVALVVAADVDETPHADEAPSRLVRRLATSKARAAAASLRTTPDKLMAAAHRPVLGSDTVVALGGVPLGKPRDADDAVAMLQAQAGRTVTVWSGVAVTDAGTDGDPSIAATAVVATLLQFRELTTQTIEAYLATGEPYGVAGAFRIQGEGASLIADRHGCWSNVVGLPVCESGRLLRAFGQLLAPDACVASGRPTDLPQQ